MSDTRSPLNPRDIAILNAQSGQNWIPKDPVDLVLPYMQKDKEDLSVADAKLAKAKRIMEGYEKLEEKSLDLCAIIEDKCKNVVVTLDPSNRLSVMEAVRRAFGTEGNQITFEMYKMAIKKFTEIANNNIPKPGDKT